MVLRRFLLSAAMSEKCWYLCVELYLRSIDGTTSEYVGSVSISESHMVTLDTYTPSLWREYRALNSKQNSNHSIISFPERLNSNAGLGWNSGDNKCLETRRYRAVWEGLSRD